ncbi:murein transglycosylase A [Neisseria leonii]|uniref:peptidoglycan lytic exotransglycosylase n=1 Tax=Neisseria leonii TaxID=2995413 RepID=A0A9X4IDP0_9NEIS|nr:MULTISPECIES: murein transglycosylase A [unclassified Neisseria]MDD9325756.1 murein transglycosylase A [Neisseria sp. 3986]MDD9327896.1 murein transglycosylase A [Neisseria sp. 51.81]
MTRTALLRHTLSALAAAVLAACTTKPIQPDGTPSVSAGVPLPAGERIPAGTVIAPSGSSASYKSVDFSALPQWPQQQFAESLKSFLNSCSRLKNQTEWQNVCTQAAQTPRTPAAARQFFERYFTPWQVSGNNRLDGTVTGYYEPVMRGDTRPTAQARFPVYGIPADFVSVPLPAHLRGSKTTVRIQQTGTNSGQISPVGNLTADLSSFPLNERSSALKGRIAGSRFVPYHTRNEINGGALDNKAPILGYADDPVELFFMQVQGSGRIQTPDGRYIRLGYADKNDYPYTSIGRYMADKGYLPLAQTTMQGIKAYIRQNPQRMAEILGQNPSYVFFRILEDNNDGPIGALGVPLTGGYSGAVDRRYITLGAPIFVATTHPETRYGLNRLMIAQDTGSAIRGAVRVDYFWGYGDEAGRTAGKMKHTGYVWQLLPNGVPPQYRP